MLRMIQRGALFAAITVFCGCSGSADPSEELRAEAEQGDAAAEELRTQAEQGDAVAA